MKNVLFCVIIALSVFNSYGQDANRQRKIFKVWVDLNREIDIRGYLVELKDSSYNDYRGKMNRYVLLRNSEKNL